MNALVLEENERISKIFTKIFEQKNLESCVARTPEDLLQIFKKSVVDKKEIDCIILDKTRNCFDGKRLEDIIFEMKSHQRIIFLLENSIESELSETEAIIQKPFALIKMLTKIEISKKPITIAIR